MALVKLMRLNEAFNQNGEVHINPDHVVAVVGEDTSPQVRVVTVSGDFYVAQPQGEGAPAAVRTQLG